MPEPGHFLPIAKLACLGLRMTTAIDRHGRIDSWQGVNQDEMSVGLDIGGFLHCLHVWWPMLMTRHVGVQGNLTSNVTYYNIPCKRRQRAIVSSKKMKGCPIMCTMVPRCE